MSKLIALVFDDPYKADEARAALFRMEGEGLLDIDETVVVVKKDGENVRVTQDTNIVSKRKQTGHLIGIIAANLTGTMPLILAGTIAGKIFGKLTDNGVTNSFIDRVKKKSLSPESWPCSSAPNQMRRDAKELSKDYVNLTREFWIPICRKNLKEKLTGHCNKPGRLRHRYPRRTQIQEKEKNHGGPETKHSNHLGRRYRLVQYQRQ